MDIATHYQSRARAQTYLEQEKAGMMEDQRSDSQSSRRKSTKPVPSSATDSTGQFRKPSLPASALRQMAATHQRQPSASTGSTLQRGPSLTNTHKRRTSAVTRDAMRVPSGPREYPGSPGKKHIPTASTSTLDTPTARTRPSFIPSSSSEPFFGLNLTYNNGADLTRGSFGNPIENGSEPGTPASQRERSGSSSFDFLPAISFDDFQTSLGTPDTGSGFNKPGPLDNFSITSNGRVLRSDTARAKAMTESLPQAVLTREPSLKQRLATRISAESKTSMTAHSAVAKPTQSKSRRQSSIPSVAQIDTDPRLVKMTRAGNVNSMQALSQAPTQAVDHSQSPSAVKRRTTIVPSVAQVPEKTKSGTTSSAKPRRKSLLPPPQGLDPNTPNDKQATKSNSTPNSSGNGRRQSIASGRASGLGARTISPTDARRLKRMSVAPQQPPLPFALRPQPTSGDDTASATPVASQQGPAKFYELPQLRAVPSPSLIPTRKDSSSLTSNSARASPSEGGSAIGKFGFPFPSVSAGQTLSTKSSFSSLHNVSTGGTGNTQSRVPVPKSRSGHSSLNNNNSNDESQSFDEIIPPVPAIPKGYDSPKDEAMLYPAANLTSTHQGSVSHFQSASEESLLDNDLLGLPTADLGRSSFDSDRPRQAASRKSVVGPRSMTTTSTGRVPSAAPHEQGGSFSSFAQTRPTDQTGRQNNNLQPLRLPPLNMLPVSATSRAVNANQFPRPSQELDERDSSWASGVRTPDWGRNGHKTPSTPMTASKASFFRRQGDGSIFPRSSTSHFGVNPTSVDVGPLRTGWLEDGDDANNGGLPITSTKIAPDIGRNAITPFASGSLPKSSGDFVRLQGRPSGDFGDSTFFHGTSFESPRLVKSKTADERPTLVDAYGRSLSIDQLSNPSVPENFSPIADTSEKEQVNGKKESGLRRKLSLGWRRSGSKAASRAEHHKLDSKESNSFLPPQLPASVAFSGDGSLGLSGMSRPSLDSSETMSLTDRLRRKKESTNKGSVDSTLQDGSMAVKPSGLPKTRSIHIEQPQPGQGLRSSSWHNFHRQSGIAAKSHLTQPRSSKASMANISALNKDKDDLIADEEMRRLTQKRKEVEQVAEQTERLMQRATPKQPMDLEKILHDRHNSLNIFERGEVVEYESDGVYFTGTKNAKKIVGSLHPSSQPVDAKDDKSKATNYGYDDERGDYNIVFGDHLAYRYEVCDVLGKGSFGQVVRCIDHKDGGVVAIKIIRNKKRFHQQALVEVGILGKLRDWDPDGAYATLSISGSFYFRSHLCIVTPCFSINLYELIKAHNFSGFALPIIRRFARQLLACLVLLQQKKVIHCDLKPENILLCSARAADIRVIDFGSSCNEDEKVYTYIQSRFYRSPEVIMGSSYGLGIDMWSFGCILCELLTGSPIFPGENEQDQLAAIMEIFGPPEKHLVERSTRKKLFFDSVGKPRVHMSSKGRRRRPSSKTLQQALQYQHSVRSEDEAFMDFVARCLRWDPERRMKPNEAISHPFITNQPLHQRGGIPDEARRAARVRSTAAVPAPLSTSPVKRTAPVVAATPQRGSVGNRQPETPQTALRAPVGASMQVSPAKAVNRRQSTAASAGGAAAALANSRRQSSGAALAASMNLAMSKAASGASLAEKAARESMAATASNTNGTGRWRI